MAQGGLTRRHLFAASLVGGASLLASTSLARTIAGGIPWVAGMDPEPRGFDGLRFLTDAERRCVDAIVSRLIPTDDAGPGAREAGVIDFIDNQLAGQFGRGERWYMRGPFVEGTEQQGYQSEQTPAELNRAAIESLDKYSRDRFDGKVFAELPEAEQDAILKRMDEGELELDGVSASAYFSMVHENAIEGFFCDPIYGGNRDMIGWRYVGFPGARYDYRDFLDHNGSAIPLEPVSLKGRPGWNVE